MKLREQCVNKVRILTKRKHEKVLKKNHRSKNIKTELKNLIEGFNNRLDEEEEKTGELKDRVVEFILSEKQRGKIVGKKMKIA